ncbi:uncharacterized protein [Watersipora subatra]
MAAKRSESQQLPSSKEVLSRRLSSLFGKQQFSSALKRTTSSQLLLDPTLQSLSSLSVKSPAFSLSEKALSVFKAPKDPNTSSTVSRLLKIYHLLVIAIYIGIWKVKRERQDRRRVLCELHNKTVTITQLLERLSAAAATQNCHLEKIIAYQRAQDSTVKSAIQNLETKLKKHSEILAQQADLIKKLAQHRLYHVFGTDFLVAIVLCSSNSVFIKQHLHKLVTTMKQHGLGTWAHQIAVTLVVLKLHLLLKRFLVVEDTESPYMKNCVKLMGAEFIKSRVFLYVLALAIVKS